MKPTIDRRQFIGGVAALAASRALAQKAPSGKIAAEAAGHLPARGELLLRNAWVMTMDAELGDIAGGDVHIRDGKIVAVGKALAAPGATVLDGRGSIVLPGLVDTHWHMWNSLLRDFAGEKASDGYFATVARFGEVMTPDDMYRATRLAAAEAVHWGITTVHNFCHNARSREHVEADIRALQESGLRGRYSYGWAQGLADTQLCNLGDLEGLHRDWPKFAGGGLLSLGFAWRGMFRASALPESVYRAEFETARRLGLPISAHVGNSEIDSKGQIEALAKANLLGRDVQILHALSATPAEIAMLASAGATVSLSPGTELRMGYGITKAGDFLDAGVQVGVSVDNTVLAGDANMFALLKMIRNIENGRSHNEYKMSARRALELGTIDGARSLGLDATIGSLKPGKRADVIMISTQRLNMGVFTDPAHMLVESAQAENVDTVIADGRILKRAGKLTAMATAPIFADAAASLEAMRKRANWR